MRLIVKTFVITMVVLVTVCVFGLLLMRGCTEGMKQAADEQYRKAQEDLKGPSEMIKEGNRPGYLDQYERR